MKFLFPPARRFITRPLCAMGLFALTAATQAADAPSAASSAASSLSTELQKTIVRSERLEARNDGREGHYVFIGNVRITGTNLEITCDRLEIFSVSEPDDARPANALTADSGVIRRLLATGNVTIAQQGRRATCGVAEVLPPEDVIILTENPVVTDVGTGVTMKGTVMRAFRGERSMEIENPEVVGPALPNLGFPNQSPQPPPTPPEAAAPPAAP